MGGAVRRRQELDQEAKRAAEGDSGPRRPLSRSSGGGRSLAVAFAAAGAVTAAAIAEVEEDLESNLQLLQNQVISRGGGGTTFSATQKRQCLS